MSHNELRIYHKKNLLLENIVSRAATDLSYIKRPKKRQVKIARFLNYVIEIFLLFLILNKWNWLDEIILINSSKTMMLFIDQLSQNAQIIIDSEKYPDAGIIFDYAIEKKTQAYWEVVSCFRQLAEDNFLRPYFTENIFWTSNFLITFHEKIDLVIVYMFMKIIFIKIFLLFDL